MSYKDHPSYYDKVVLAHGILGCVAWVVLFPLGGIIIRVSSHRSVFWIHTILQTVALAMFTVAFGSGIWFGMLYGSFYSAHLMIGILLWCFSALQPILGILHHRKIQRYNRRVFSSVLHILLGRMLITIGIINGGLGLLLSENATSAECKAYGVIGGLVWIAYIVIVSLVEVQDEKRNKRSFSADYSSETDSAKREIDEDKLESGSDWNPAEKRQRGAGKVLKDAFIPQPNA